MTPDHLVVLANEHHMVLEQAVKLVKVFVLLEVMASDLLCINPSAAETAFSIQTRITARLRFLLLD